MNSAYNSLSQQTVDQVFFYILYICIALLLLVTGLMIFFVIKYRKSRHPRPERVKESAALEAAWTVAPTLIALSMFWYGYTGFKVLRTPPKDSLIVNVTGQQWRWSFTYANGKTSDQLWVPLGKPVKLLLHSVDVIHGFYIPAFHIKEDVVPGRENYLWLKPESMGPADIFCTQFCGLNHAYMMSKVLVVSPEEFDKWLALKEGAAAAAPGAAKTDAAAAEQKLYTAKGCNVCHSADGAKGIGPTFKGLFGSSVTLQEGSAEKSLKADEAYLAESIQNPATQIVKGFPNVMPVQKDLTEADVKALLAYIESLK